MRARYTTAVLTLVLSLSVTGREAAAGSIVFDNGLPGAGGTQLTNYIVAEDFMFSSDAVLLRARVWADGPAFTGSFTWFIFEDSPAYPGYPGSTILATGTSTSETFDVGEIPLSGNTRYWLGLHNGPLSVTDCDGRHERFGWRGTTPNTTARAKETQYPCTYTAADTDPAPWYRNFNEGLWVTTDFSGEHAFRLKARSVPEPATIMMIGAAVSLAIVRRRRRRER